MSKVLEQYLKNQIKHYQEVIDEIQKDIDNHDEYASSESLSDLTNKRDLFDDVRDGFEYELEQLEEQALTPKYKNLATFIKSSIPSVSEGKLKELPSKEEFTKNLESYYDKAGTYDTHKEEVFFEDFIKILYTKGR